MQLHPPPAFGGGRGWCSESTVGLGMGVALRLQQPGLKGKDAPSRQMMCALEDGGAVQGTVGAALSMAVTQDPHNLQGWEDTGGGLPPSPLLWGQLVSVGLDKHSFFQEPLGAFQKGDGLVPGASELKEAEL